MGYVLMEKSYPIKILIFPVEELLKDHQVMRKQQNKGQQKFG